MLNRFFKMAGVLLAVVFAASVAKAGDADTVAISGYDLVSYQEASGPVRGHGNFVVRREEGNYLFASKENMEKFQANPEKYLPAFGGYCAFGVKMGLKLHSDPMVYKVVDGKLYLNLDKKVAGIWEKDVPGNISEANTVWTKIKNTPASELTM